MQPLKIRNRLIGDKEFRQIRLTIQTHWRSGRSAISRILCQQWDWKQANGQYKEMACRELLLRLEQMGYIELPPRRILQKNERTIRPLPQAYRKENSCPLTGAIDAYSHIDIELAQTNEKKRLWDSLVDAYHYLGCKQIVGVCFRYFVYIDDHLAACFGWGSAAWKVGCRDQFIGWSHELRSQRLNRIANNTRFVILPWVCVHNFASKALSLSAGRLAEDWTNRFQEPLVLLETFVDRSRFGGTCYKAANWLYLGQTKGSGKKGASYRHHGIIKSVFVYALTPEFRLGLCQ